jgi:uncharacterized lipoprotein YmbA
MKTSLKALTAILLLCSMGCFRSPPSRFYSLLSLQEVESDPPLSSEGCELEVGSVVFPQYLSDPRIAVRTGANEISRDEYERWIEDPDVNFRQALLDNLSRELRSSNVFSSELYPQRRGAQLLQVEVLQFDVTEEGRAVLRIRWATAHDRAALATASFTVSEFTAHAQEETSEERVAALSFLVRDFSRAVAHRVAPKSP